MSVVVIDRDDLMQMLNDFKEQITKEIKQSFANINESASKLLNKKETAEFFGVSQSTIDRWREDVKDFPAPIFIENGGRPMWELKDLQEYIKNKKQSQQALKIKEPLLKRLA